MVDEMIYIPRHRLDVVEMANFAMKKGWKRVLYYAVVSSALIGFMIYNLIAPMVGLSVSTVVLISSLIFVIIVMNAYQKTKSVYANQAQSLAFEDRTIHFDQRSITVDYAKGASSTFPWTCFVKEEWRSDFLLIYITGLQYVTIPRRVLDEHAEAAIKQALQTAKQQQGLVAPPRML